MTEQWKAKPIATYRKGSKAGPAVEGSTVWLHCVSHPAPQLCGKQVRTSQITRVGSFGVFETLNTVYIPDREWVQ